MPIDTLLDFVLCLLLAYLIVQMNDLVKVARECADELSAARWERHAISRWRLEREQGGLDA